MNIDIVIYLIILNKSFWNIISHKHIYKYISGNVIWIWLFNLACDNRRNVFQFENVFHISKMFSGFGNGKHISQNVFELENVCTNISENKSQNVSNFGKCF